MQQMNVSSPMNNTELNLKTLFKKRKRKETYFQTTFSKHPIRFEFEVLSCAMVPMLSCVDKIRLQRVSKGFYACVARQLEWHKITPQKEFEGYWYFLERHFKRTNLLQDFCCLVLKSCCEKACIKIILRNILTRKKVCRCLSTTCVQRTVVTCSE